MKKIIKLLAFLLVISIVTGCQSQDSTTDEGAEEEAVAVTDENEQGEEEASEELDVSMEPVEPEADDECAFCQMEIYGKDEEMGVFTAQAITKDGENLFFDDSGCLVNYVRENEDTVETQWVRDYVTIEWINKDESIPVETNIQSPMKYGYVFLDSNEKAEQFVSENSEFDPTIIDWEQIDEVAKKRLEQKRQQGDHHDDHHDHSHE